MKRITAAILAFMLLALGIPALCDDEEIYFVSATPTPDPQDAPLDATPAPEEPVVEADGSVLLTMSFTGDVTIGGDVRKTPSIFDQELTKQGGDLGFVFKNVKDIFAEDDMTLVNFEGTLGELAKGDIPSSKKDNQFLFTAPARYVDVLTLGNVDAVALENNHVMDYGQKGFDSTKEILAEAGITYSCDGELGVFTAKGVEIAMLSYQTFDRYPTLFEQVPRDVAAAKAQYPIVIVSFHWGAELDYKPNDNQQKMGKIAIDAGADLVIGHHSHRINPIEEYKGKYICYSLGNFSFAGNTKPSDMSTYIFQIRFRVKDGVAASEGFRIIPCRISSKTDYNDFIPTPYTGQSQIDNLLSVLKKNGNSLDNPVAEYPLDWPLLP